ncbi:Por secretion system C-terminal sorting domain-containing protein [Aequorivita viscosa]|uniref:Por secretion system C-terminal sorting domain-containing protein n=2 Tax=Aequorivita viscosa TaxID=797419 RepID=A0A1M6CQM3_9FLAO|nr:T9SS type A sorting domain-containing protein [Aequorivita viscosa]SDW39614.1 Por secretion system C-terminal sorting domain-containing protein [Aequorivita viscosa]SHI63270.1 Por secretion system C-terminal sorting domain-containing protein [Aequorivita viscosa]
MRKRILFFFSLFLVCAVFSQEGQIPMPKSWGLNLTNSPKVEQLNPINLALIRKQDSINDLDKSIPWRYGIERNLNLNSNSGGLWNDLADGGRIWRAVVQSQNAINLSLNFNDFYLPEGARLQIYNDDQTEIAQTLNSSHNRDSKKLGTWFVNGDIIWIEYYQPPHVSEAPRLDIKSVVHGYRLGEIDISNPEGNRINGSGNCNYDVNCPIGSDFESQKNILKKSVAFVNLGNGYLCSAVLINNAKADKTPYLLTANHCVVNSDPSFWSIRFNWISPNPVCGTDEESGDLQNNFTVSGAELIASNSLSDFALVKLYDDIPESWDVAFAGWDNSDTDPVFEVGIHHPNGDIMKICRDNSGATKENANGTEVWLIGGGQHGTGNGWEIGTTESGSSGSPLFNENGKIIGQLYAGESACTGFENNQNYDIYGRFGVSWNAGNSPETRLKDWLDPDNSGETSIETLQNILNVPDFQTIGELKVYPNPVSTSITVQNDRYPHLSYQFSNMMGQQIQAGSLSNTMNTISVEDLAEGIYLLVLTDNDSSDSITKKIVVKRQ